MNINFDDIESFTGTSSIMKNSKMDEEMSNADAESNKKDGLMEDDEAVDFFTLGTNKKIEKQFP